MWLATHQASNEIEIEIEIKLHWIYKNKDLCRKKKLIHQP